MGDFTNHPNALHSPVSPSAVTGLWPEFVCWNIHLPLPQVSTHCALNLLALPSSLHWDSVYTASSSPPFLAHLILCATHYITINVHKLDGSSVLPEGQFCQSLWTTRDEPEESCDEWETQRLVGLWSLTGREILDRLDQPKSLKTAGLIMSDLICCPLSGLPNKCNRASKLSTI